jgi:hypothetical protein
VIPKVAADRVLTVNEYYDGPRLGVAELNGIAHVYEAEFDHNSDEYGDTYFLSPIDEGLLGLVLEDWAIWCRWHSAYGRGDVTLESHPALPEDRQRHEELKRLIGNGLSADPNNRRRFKGTFSAATEARGTWNGALVEWQER